MRRGWSDGYNIPLDEVDPMTSPTIAAPKTRLTLALTSSSVTAAGTDDNLNRHPAGPRRIRPGQREL